RRPPGPPWGRRPTADRARWVRSSHERRGSRPVSWFNRLLARIDRVQSSRRWLAIPVAVIKKYGDDRGGYLAALIAYYAFLSLFPLMLLMVTLLGIALAGNPDLRASIETSALR